MAGQVTTPPAEVPPAVLALAGEAWFARMRDPYPTTAAMRDAAASAAYRAGLAAASALNDNTASSCWGLRLRSSGRLQCVAHGTNGGQQLAKILAGMRNARAWELLRWDGARWVVVAGVA